MPRHETHSATDAPLLKVTNLRTGFTRVKSRVVV